LGYTLHRLLIPEIFRTVFLDGTLAKALAS
jgi:hypothetical protein